MLAERCKTSLKYEAQRGAQNNNNNKIKSKYIAIVEYRE